MLGLAYRVIIKATVLTNAHIMFIGARPTFASNYQHISPGIKNKRGSSEKIID